jgi:ubiquinone/menaquinone biosynthesis C-methylase UbiE
MMNQFEAVNRAFSKQSFHYDQDDQVNPVLQDMRQQVYDHVLKFIKPNSSILELNAGTGIDALHFTALGHHVHATDLSDGMILQIKNKVQQNNLYEKLSYQQLSYNKLQQITGIQFDYVFSNFGGLNCIPDLTSVTKQLPGLLKPGAYVTWVIMPRVSPWELAGALKGHVKKAMRRFNKNGIEAHLEGESFTTYYHTLTEIKAAFGAQFKFIMSEGLAALSPPPHRGDLPLNSPVLYKTLRRLDQKARIHFPFNRWADHIIVTFQFVK